MIAQLIPLDGSDSVTITSDLTIVGRKRGLCDMIIAHSSISKLHCAIAKTDGLLFIRDLGSTNGTKVNGQRVMRGALLPGDELCFANTRYRVFLGPGESRPQMPQRTEPLDQQRVIDKGEIAVLESDAEILMSGDNPQPHG